MVYCCHLATNLSTGLSHIKKPDNPVYTFKNGDHGFRTRFNVLIHQHQTVTEVNIIQHCLFSKRTFAGDYTLKKKHER